MKPHTEVATSRLTLFIGAILLQAAPPAPAQNATLLNLINSFRESPQTCGGQQMPAAGPLEPDDKLSQVKLSSAAGLQQALKQSGYQAARAQAMMVSGTSDPEQAMQAIRQQYCSQLMSQQFSAAGVSHDGRQWTIVLAKPLLSPNLGDWRQAGKQVLQLVNDARGKARDCGKRHFEPTGPLEWNAKLASAAHVHSKDMADNNYFSHQAKDGSDVGDRARRAGYAWREIGENIAAGQGSPKQVMSAWLASPGHCANIMNPAFSEMGAAYVTNPDSDATIYWTQVLGKR